jgi:hypothetical protein
MTWAPGSFPEVFFENSGGSCEAHSHIWSGMLRKG